MPQDYRFDCFFTVLSEQISIAEVHFEAVITNADVKKRHLY